MEYTTEVTIDLARERVIELFDNPDHLSKWQEGLRSFEPLDGTPGHPGATSKLVYDMNGRSIEMVETIVARELPDRFTATYETDGVYNHMDNRFIEVTPNQTRWVTVSEFRFSGFMMRLMGIFAPGMFKRQTLQQMNQFKAFAEEVG